MNKFKIKFFLLIGLELIIFPIIYIRELYKNLNSSKEKLNILKNRKDIEERKIYINIHEWGGYGLKRTKSIHEKIPTFECGLFYQLERFKKQNVGSFKKYINVTMSEKEKYKEFDYVYSNTDNIDFVSNFGMDFSGYSFFFNKIKNEKNAYLILTNTSVNAISPEDFLEDYIDYMETNKDVAILGISYSTRMGQSLIRNNFIPHLQSFFYLTTIDVLNEILNFNNSKFPGENTADKLLLIREGEIKMSVLAHNLGYNLAVITEEGTVFKFGKNKRKDNGYNRWTLPKGDMRKFVENPNKINKILK